MVGKMLKFGIYEVTLFFILGYALTIALHTDDNGDAKMIFWSVKEPLHTIVATCTLF